MMKTHVRNDIVPVCYISPKIVSLCEKSVSISGKTSFSFVFFFAVCNRTYYGDVGKTYELKLDKPIEGRLPFLCHLTFTANGHMHGDIVQVSIFTIKLKFLYIFHNKQKNKQSISKSKQHTEKFEPRKG